MQRQSLYSHRGYIKTGSETVNITTLIPGSDKQRAVSGLSRMVLRDLKILIKIALGKSGN